MKSFDGNPPPGLPSSYTNSRPRSGRALSTVNREGVTYASCSSRCPGRTPTARARQRVARRPRSRIRGTITNATTSRWHAQRRRSKSRRMARRAATAIVGGAESTRLQTAAVHAFPIHRAQGASASWTAVRVRRRQAGWRISVEGFHHPVVRVCGWSASARSDAAIGGVVKLDGKPLTIVGSCRRTSRFRIARRVRGRPGRCRVMGGRDRARFVSVVIFPRSRGCAPAQHPLRPPPEATSRSRAAPDPGLAPLRCRRRRTGGDCGAAGDRHDDAEVRPGC